MYNNPDSIYAEGFKIQKGINLSHWLSQVPDWMDRDEFIVENDIKNLAEWGFDHVRIPIDEEVMWNEDGSVNEKNFGYLISCLDWCVKYKLRAVVDLHILKSHHFNAQNNEGQITLWTDTTAQKNFLKLWQDISGRLNHYPAGMVAYELMNEAVAEDHEDWNRLIAATVPAIRKLEPERILVIGSNRWQTAAYFPYLKVPEGDTNIILSVHTYDPILFTHYEAAWNPQRDYHGPVSYPGLSIKQEDIEKYVDASNTTLKKYIHDSNREYDKEELERILQPAVNRSAELGLPLYCGEFGCLPTVDREMRLKYYKDITSVFKKNNMSCAAWDYKGNFGIVGYDTLRQENTEVDIGLINILTK